MIEYRRKYKDSECYAIYTISEDGVDIRDIRNGTINICSEDISDWNEMIKRWNREDE